MKKCASCAKDLPEAALHCVFCGAKQPPAPAVGPGLAKTAFGYSANEVMNQLGRSGAPQATPQYQPPTSTSPYGQRPQPASQPPPYGQPQQPYNQGPYQQQGGPVPQSTPHAATVAIAPGGGPAPLPYATTQPAPYQQPQAGAYQVPYQQQPSQGMGINAPNPHTPPPLSPMQAQAYARGPQQTGPVPIEPWRYSLRMHMMIWGAVMLAVFATPVTTDPMHFNWDGIGDMPSKLLIMTLLVPAVGVLAIVFGSAPIPTLVRGIASLVLGLVIMLAPIAITGEVPPWQFFVGLVAALTLIPGLLVRNEYTNSMVARILVTIGVICTLVPLLVPVGGELPLVLLFKALLDAPGKGKVMPIVEIGGLVLVVMSLLAWMPSPATGAAKMFAWAIILWGTLVKTIAQLLLAHDIGDAITKTPGHVVEWGVFAAVAVLIGYGAATVIGKQLE